MTLHCCDGTLRLDRNRCCRGSLTGVVGDRFGHVERGRVAAHIVRADFAFGDDASDRVLETRGHVRFVEPVEHQLGGRFLDCDLLV